MKVENDLDVLSVGDPIAVSTDEVHVPSAFSVMKAESEVSTVFSWCVCTHACTLYIAMYYVTFGLCFEEHCFVGCNVISLLEIYRYFKGT
jgi:hypothetical protein